MTIEQLGFKAQQLGYVSAFSLLLAGMNLCKGDTFEVLEKMSKQDLLRVIDRCIYYADDERVKELHKIAVNILFKKL